MTEKALTGSSMKYTVLIACILIPGVLLQPLNPVSPSGTTRSSVAFTSSSDDLSRLPSYRPVTFRSGSGKVHLLFQHEVHYTDVVYYKYYHVYMHENGSWSSAKQLEAPFHAFDMQIRHVIPNENGFTLYYSVENKGVYSWTYQEREDSWQEPDLLFGKANASAFLQSGENFILYLHGILVSSPDEVHVAWSFEVPRSTHPFEERYIISTVHSNGSTVSQVLGSSSGSYSPGARLVFVPVNDTIFLFEGKGQERAVLLPNTTWSIWQEPDQEEQALFKLYQCLTGVPSKSREIMAFTGFTSQIDLKNISSNYSSPPFEPLVRTDFMLNLSSQADPVTTTMAITNQSIEPWHYDFLTRQWSQISRLNHTFQNQTFRAFYDDSPKDCLDMVINDSVLYLFWDEQVSAIYHYEIFSVSFDTRTNSWSPITRITGAALFTDDDITGHYTPSFLTSTLPVLAVIAGLKRTRKRP